MPGVLYFQLLTRLEPYLKKELGASVFLIDMAEMHK